MYQKFMAIRETFRRAHQSMYSASEAANRGDHRSVVRHLHTFATALHETSTLLLETIDQLETLLDEREIEGGEDGQ